MKQKIVIQVSMCCDKSRSKAMTLAARTAGVISMGITGDGRDRLEVVGVDVDSACLVCCLRKKLGHADIILVQEVKDKKPDEKKAPEEKKDDPKPPCFPPGYYYQYHYPPMVVDCGEPTGPCAIMYI